MARARQARTPAERLARGLRLFFGFAIVTPLLLRIPGHYYASADLQSFVIGLGAFALSLGLVALARTDARAIYPTASWGREGWLVVFAAWIALAWCAAREPTASLQASLRWFPPIVTLLAIPALVGSPAVQRRALGWLVAGGAVLASVFLLNLVRADVWRSLSIDGFPAPPPRNILALLLVPSFFASLALCGDPEPRVRRLLGYAPAGLLVFALLLTRSRGTWIGIAVGGVVLVAFGLAHEARGRVLRALALAAAVVLLLGAVATWTSYRLGAATPADAVASLLRPDRGSAGGRVRRWANGWPMVADHPWLGVGPGNWTAVWPRYRGRVMTDPGGDTLPYNSYLGLAAEAGLPGCLALVLFFTGVLRARRRAAPPSEAWVRACLAASLAALLVAAAFHDVFSNALLLGAVFLTAGLLVAHDAMNGDARVRLRGAVAVALAVVGGLAVVAEARHLRASLHSGMLIEGVVFEGPGRRLAPSLAPGALDRIVRWVFSAFEGSDEELWALWQSERSIRPRGPALILADREAQAGDCDDARSWVDRVLASSPHPDALRIAGDCARGDGRPLEALDAYERGLALNDTVPELHARRADVLAELDRVDEADVAYDEATRLFRERLVERFGASSLHGAQRDVDALDGISRKRRLLRARTRRVRSDEELWRAVASTPLLHKGLARAGSRLFFSSTGTGEFDLWAMDLRHPGARPRLLSRDSLAAFRPRVPPDGGRVYFVSDREGDYRYKLYEQSLAERRPRRLTPPLAGDEGEFELSADGRTLAVRRDVGRAQDVHLVDTEDRTYRRVTTDGRPKRDLAFSPDGSTVAWVEADRRVVLLDVPTGGTSIAVEHDATKLRWPRFSPSGERIAFVAIGAGGRRTLAWLDRRSGRESRLPTRSGQWLEPLWIDEATLVVRERVADEYLLARVDLETGETKRVGPDSGVVYPAILLDEESGPSLAYAYGGASVPVRVERLDVRTGVRRPLVRVEDFEDEEIVLHETVAVSGLRTEARAHLYPPPGVPGAPRPAILWLAGGAGEFSPRWHPYAQAFARAGFVFAAPSEVTETPTEDALRRRALEALATRDLLASRPDVDEDRVFAIAVSSGTRVLADVLARRPDAFAAAVEYSPIPSEAWSRPRPGLPPFLIFLPENDPHLDVSRRIRAMEAQRRAGTVVDWTVLPGEGHDLRGGRSIRRRMDETLDFLRARGVRMRDPVRRAAPLAARPSARRPRRG